MRFYSFSRLLPLTVTMLFSIGLSAQTPDQLTSQQPTQGSTVRGRAIYSDSQPVKGVRVRVFSTREGPRDGRPTVLTNERGEFLINGLAAGKYYVSLEGSGVAQPSGMGMRIPVPLAAIPGAGDYPEIIPKHDAQFTVDGQNAIEVEVKIIRGGR
jgi:hypothetical protein